MFLWLIPFYSKKFNKNFDIFFGKNLDKVGFLLHVTFCLALCLKTIHILNYLCFNQAQPKMCPSPPVEGGVQN